MLMKRTVRSSRSIVVSHQIGTLGNFYIVTFNLVRYMGYSSTTLVFACESSVLLQVPTA